MYSISEEWPTPDWEEKMDFSLFTRKGYWNIRQSETSSLPLLVKDKSGQIVSFWCFALVQNAWRTPYKAPYFEPYVSDEKLIPEILTVICNYLRSKKAQGIEINFPPVFLFGNSLKDLILLQDTDIFHVEATSFLKVNKELPFSNSIKEKEKRRKLRQLQSSSYTVSLAKIEEWNNLYEQLLQWRKSKGHQNLISKDLILKYQSAFPAEYNFLKLVKNKQLAGLALFIKIKSNVFYVYALIINPQFDGDSPSVLLWDAIYQSAREQQVELIDMGTSMLKTAGDGSLINRGLLKNKIALGGSLEKKYSIKC